MVRRAFSDPRVPHESTGVHGRGTEEVKTNDVSGRVKAARWDSPSSSDGPAWACGSAISRRCAGRWREAGVAFEKKNPVTSLMSDVATGTIREDILNEKVLSAIIEIKVPVERAEEIIRLVWDVEKQIDTVVALGVGARCDAEGEENVVAPILEKLGYNLERAKTNIGLGRVNGVAMTNTLHRFGPSESFADDYIVFAMCARGKNDDGRAAQAAAVSGNGGAVQAGESGRRDSRRRAAAVARDESAGALESRFHRRFRGGDRRPGRADYRRRGVR